MRFITALFLVILLSANWQGFAQVPGGGLPQVFVARWQAPRTVPVYMQPGLEVQAPAFEGCLYDARLYNLPYGTYTMTLQPGQTAQVMPLSTHWVEQENMDYFDLLAGLPDGGAYLFDESDWYPANPVTAHLMYVSGTPVLQLQLFPLQIHRSGTRIRTTDSLKYAVALSSDVTTRAGRSPAKTAATESQLANGTWYRLAVATDGIYSLDRTQLAQMGLDVQGLDPRNVRIHGRPGGMLPQANSADRDDDLPELAILVTGEADGTLDAADRVLFYGQGPHRIFYDGTNNRLRQENHLYADSTYYYLTVGSVPGKRMAASPAGQSPDTLISYTRRLSVYHRDLAKVYPAGQLWVGENFKGNTLSRSLQLSAPAARSNGSHRLYVRGLGRAPVSTSLSVREGSTLLGNLNFFSVQYDCSWCQRARITESLFNLTDAQLADGMANLTLTYNINGVGEGWLDYAVLDYEQAPRLSGVFQPMYIPLPDDERVIGLSLAQATAVHQVWDVTDPLNVRQVTTTLEDGSLNLQLPVSGTTQLVACTPAAYQSPAFVGRVANQNLHGLAQADYLVIAHPPLVAEARRLAQWHQQRSGYSYQVVTPQQIYHEFSAGSPDVTALRDFVRMFWLRAASEAERPKFLLLMGTASYDFKNQGAGGNLVPAYAARQSLFPPEAYVSDDYFTFMDATEGFWGENDIPTWNDNQIQRDGIDLAVGRLPVRTVDEARQVVDKIMRYDSPSAAGEWKTQTLFIGDFVKNECNHMSEADLLVRNGVEPHAPCLLNDKVYLDAFPAVSSANGIRYPAARQRILEQVNKGALIVNYTGHGGVSGFSNSEIFELPDIQGMTNGDRMALWITATCDFGRYDNPAEVCGARELLVAPQGGAIGLFTSVRSVFSNGNYAFNLNAHRHLFTFLADKGRHITMGEAMMRAKNDTWQAHPINTRAFAYLGDPALSLSLPTWNAVLTEVNTQAPNAASLQALGMATLKGEIQDAGGNRLEDFDGTVTVMVYDKARNTSTAACSFSFNWEKTLLFNGKSSVQAGRFETQFVVPLDIDFTAGQGRISLYAQAATGEAAGCTREVTICCTDPNPVHSEQAPTVRIYMNDPQWRDGSLVTPHPVLWAEVSSELGINTSGLGIGRELMAVLDDNTGNPIVLNSFYQSTVDDFRQGNIRYPMFDLPEGPHTLSVKVWDVANRSATAQTHFIVASSTRLAIAQLMNYPNPFVGSTRIQFSHNQPGVPLRVEVFIRDMTGKLVERQQADILSNAFVVEPFEWKGNTADGAPARAGMYVFELVVTNPQSGETLRRHSRMVLLRGATP
ncbi:MAG: type IX secretion system sortase PorU [Bacteroidetes bacterium]|nr:type IX secretion system sortase PorU [Bacteroidota bacterium]